MARVDIAVEDGLVTAYNLVIGGTTWETMVSDIEVPEEFCVDWWEGKWAYDADAGMVTLSGAEAPPQEPWPEPELPLSEKVDALEAELLGSYMAQAELYERTLALEAENVSNMMAMAEMYEMLIGGM